MLGIPAQQLSRMREQICLERFAPRGLRPEKSAVAEKDVFDGLQAVKVKLQVYAKAGYRVLPCVLSCVYLSCNAPLPSASILLPRKSAATWGLIPAKNPAAVANASVISASKAHTVVLLADRVQPMPSYVMSQPGGVSFCTSRCGVAVPSPR